LKGVNHLNQTLLIIDAQQELIDGNQEESSVFNKKQLIRNINKAIEKARESDVPVVFVRDLDVAEGKGEGFQVHNEINVPTDAKIFDKSATNSFHGTGLLDHLRSQLIEHVVVMGCLDVTLVGDGHSTTDNEVLSAEQIINHHNSTLHGHYNVEHFSVVRNIEENLFRPIHDSYR